MKKIIIIALCITLIFLTATIGVSTFETTNDTTARAKLKIKVCDSSGDAIKDVKITIVEDNIYFYTDNNGNTPTMDVSFAVNKYDSGANWSVVTIIAAKKGFVDTIIYNCVVYNDKTRNILPLTLLTSSQTTFPFVALVETPPNDWQNNFIERYK